MRQKGGKMSFADFLDVMHTHSTKEKIPHEIIQAFKNMDTSKKGVIPARDLWTMLAKWGEKLSPREGKIILKPFNTHIRYHKFLRFQVSIAF